MSLDVYMMILRGFIRREGTRSRRRGRRDMMTAATTSHGWERTGRGPDLLRTPPTMTRYTAPSPPEVLILLTPKPPRMTMTNRGAWWEYFSSGYA